MADDVARERLVFGGPTHAEDGEVVFARIRRPVGEAVRRHRRRVLVVDAEGHRLVGTEQLDDERLRRPGGPPTRVYGELLGRPLVLAAPERDPRVEEESHHPRHPPDQVGPHLWGVLRDDGANPQPRAGNVVRRRRRALQRDQLPRAQRSPDGIEQLDHRVVADEVRALRLVKGDVGHVHEVVVVGVAGHDRAHVGQVLAQESVDALTVGVDLAQRDLADRGVRVERRRHHRRPLPPDDQPGHAEEGDLDGVRVRPRLRDERRAGPGRGAAGDQGDGEEGRGQSRPGPEATGQNFR